MRHDLDARTRLLLHARGARGNMISLQSERSLEVMRQMVEEGLFHHSSTMFSEGYLWTPAGESAAEAAYQQVPVRPFQTGYRDHPQVSISLNELKEELCHVTGPNCVGITQGGLWVRESLGRWLVDHPNGEEVKCFGSADEAIKWALEQAGKK